MEQIFNIDQVNVEVRRAISKLGTPALLKKYNQKNFVEKDQIISAHHFLLKRGVDPQEIKNATDFYLEYIFKVSSKEEQVFDAEKEMVKEVKAMILKDVNVEEKEEEVVEIKKEKKKKKAKKEKENPIIKLTKNEFKLFEGFRSQLNLQQLIGLFDNRKQFKGVLGSLVKKKILTECFENIEIGPVGQQIISNELPYKEKVGYERNFFTKKRVLIEIDGKSFEKSAYVRHLLKKNKHLTCSEADQILSSKGFPKLYYSEFKRCKDQLGIVKIKDLDEE